MYTSHDCSHFVLSQFQTPILKVEDVKVDLVVTLCLVLRNSSDESPQVGVAEVEEHIHQFHHNLQVAMAVDDRNIRHQGPLLQL
jgi:hypothetical protein